MDNTIVVESNTEDVVILHENVVETSNIQKNKDDESSKNEMPSCSHSQPLILETFKNIQSFSSGTKNQKMTRRIVQMIVKDNLAFDFVEGAGFLEFMKECFPLYKVPTRNTIKAHIDTLYESEKKKCVQLLSNMKCLSLTTDIWTNIDMKSMLGITFHGLLDKKQFNGTIGVVELAQSHSSLYISEVLNCALKDFCIDRKDIMAVVTDNGANMVKAIHETFGRNRHIPCFAHTLNLVCSNSLRIPEVDAIILKCRTIVKWFKRSVKANDEMRKIQAASGISEGKILKLQLDVKTRWNSTYYMIERFIKLSSYISQILLNYTESPPMISSREKDELMEILILLRPLEAMTVQISGEKYGSLSQIIPLVHCGHEQIFKVLPNQPAAKKLKEGILNEFHKRFGTIEHSFMLAASTILDPTFKKVHFKDGLALSSVMRFLRIEMSETDETADTGSESSMESAESEFDLWAPHKTLVHKKRKRVNEDIHPQDELTYYLNCQVLPLESNVINAWEDMKTVYPKLYELSKKYCHLLGTSVPAERLFSKAGATATLKRNRLTTKRLSKLLFLQTWLN